MTGETKILKPPQRIAVRHLIAQFHPTEFRERTAVNHFRRCRHV